MVYVVVSAPIFCVERVCVCVCPFRNPASVATLENIFVHSSKIVHPKLHPNTCVIGRIVAIEKNTFEIPR